MGVSRVDYGEETLIDLTQDTVSSNNLLQGFTAHGADGNEVQGAVITHDVIDNLTSTSTVDALSAKQGKVLKDLLDSKANNSDVNANWQGNGYNLIPFPYTSVSSTIRGVTFTVNNDGSVNINGTNDGANGDFSFIANDANKISEMFHAEVGKKYACVYEVDGTLPEGCFIAVNGYNNSAYVKSYFNSSTINLNKPFVVTSDATNLSLYITNRSGYVFNNVTVKVMLVEVDSNGNYPTKYQRYANGNVELTNKASVIEKSVSDNWGNNGYNLIPFPYFDGMSKVNSNITWEVDNNGVITANGLTNNTSYYMFHKDTTKHPDGFVVGKRYALILSVENGTASAYWQNGGTDIVYVRNVTNQTKVMTFTLNAFSNKSEIALYINTVYGTQQNCKCKCMIVEVDSNGNYPTEYQRYGLGNVELTDELNNKISISEIINYVYPVGSIYMSVNNVSPQTFIGGTWEKIEDKFLLSSSSTHAAGSTGGAETHTITTNEMPKHTHTFTGSAVNSGNNSVGHTHSGTTGNQSVGHTHSIPALSGSAASNGAHAHNAKYTSQQVANGTGKAYFNSQGDKTSPIVVSGGAHTHTVTTNASTTGGISANHTHSFTTGGISANHTHSVTAEGINSDAGNGNAMSIMPPYLAVYMWKRTA